MTLVISLLSQAYWYIEMQSKEVFGHSQVIYGFKWRAARKSLLGVYDTCSKLDYGRQIYFLVQKMVLRI